MTTPTLNDIKLTLYRGYWAATWRQDGETKRQSMKTTDRAEAHRRMEAWKQANTAALNLIRDIVPAYIDDCRGKVSHERMEYAWKRLQPFFGPMCVDELEGPLGKRQSRAYVTLRRREVEDGTIIRELTVLRAAIYWHDKQSKAVVELPPKPPSRERHLTRDELGQLLDAAARLPHLWLFIQLAYYTAGRLRAVLKLTWDRVDLNRRLIYLGDGKNHGNKKRATVSINDPLHEILSGLVNDAKNKGMGLPVFVIDYAGGDVDSIRHSFRNAAIECGFSVDAKDPDKVTPHCLRHSAAVHMAEDGVPIEAIGQFLGHTDYNTTYRTYARFSPAYQRKAAGALYIPKRSKNNVVPLAQKKAAAGGSRERNSI
jgi:integrase